MLISCKFIIQTAMTARFRGPPIRPCRDEIKENAMVHSVLKGQVPRQRWPQGLPSTHSFLQCDNDIPPAQSRDIRSLPWGPGRPVTVVGVELGDG